MSQDLSDKIAKVLIAEDDEAMRRFLEVTLKKQNYNVSVASDGSDALNQAFNSVFDVIITDALMPNLTGYDLCRILRQTPATENIPLIILSGFDQKEGENTDAKLADFYLRKGENLKVELVNLLSNLINVKV